MEDMNKTIPPRRYDPEMTIPGMRERKKDGRFQIGDSVMGRYTVLAELGQGGMGVVYKCLDTVGKINVALKALPPELSHNTLEMEDIRDNFALVEKLNHPNIANVKHLERDSATGDYYLIMECVEGENLKTYLRKQRKQGDLTLETVLPILQQVASALDYAHAQKIIHRDVKPGNVMLDGNGTVKVLDFGLAAEIQTSMTRVSMAFYGTSGTGPYMAPEQWRGKRQGAAADQYAMAVMAYEMLAGHQPFESPDAEVLKRAVLDETADPIPGLPLAAQNALKRAMSKDPALRFSSCAEFVAALGGAKVRGAVNQSAGFRKKGLLMLGVFLLLLIGGFFVFQQSDEARPAEERIQTSRNNEAPPRPAVEKKQTSRSNDTPPRPAVEQTEEYPRQTSIRNFTRTLTLPGNVKLELIKVMAGSFEMSKSDGENDNDEKPHTAVIRNDFYLGKYEVTQAQYEAVMESNPSIYKGDNLPVECVSWNDAMSFCEKLNSQGLAPKGWYFTLPTETQWEYAARGGNRSRGYKYSGSNNLDEVAWYYANSADKTHPVGQKQSNELGFYDMSGNVWEWCLDDYEGDSSKAVPEFSRGNDRGGSCRVDRGGSWSSIARHCRSTFRSSDSPVIRVSDLGFRVALRPVQ